MSYRVNLDRYPYEVGYWKPDGQWHKHDAFRSKSAAAEACNRLNGGDGGAAERMEQDRRWESDQRDRQARDAQRAQQKSDQKIASENARAAEARARAAELEADNLTRKAQLQAEDAQETVRAQREWVRLKDAEREKWLATEQENRRRAQAEAAEQLKRFPPTETRIVGGADSWDRKLVYRLKDGQTVVLRIPVAPSAGTPRSVP
ncbi:MAG: hypothetical protein WAV90_19360 [Gordonia amarae]